MATNFAKADYQEIIDLHTEAGKVSVIGIHTPLGSKPRSMLVGLFSQFRKYKYKGCDLVMVPAARLPADPLGVSYEAGEPGSDPRDLLNPILFHGCHGDNLNAALNSIYRDGGMTRESTSVGMDENSAAAVPSDSLSWEKQYYRALSDPTFRKSNVMSAFRKRGLHPLVYNVVSNVQIGPNEVSDDIGALAYDSQDEGFQFDLDTRGHLVGGNILPRFATNKLVSLGWRDTREVLNAKAEDPLNPDSVQPGLSTLPKCYMGMLILPPAYKTEMYFRLVLTHHFQFKEFNTSLTVPSSVDYHDWNAPLTKEEQEGRSASLDTINSTATVLTDGVY